MQQHQVLSIQFHLFRLCESHCSQIIIIINNNINNNNKHQQQHNKSNGKITY